MACLGFLARGLPCATIDHWRAFDPILRDTVLNNATRLNFSFLLFDGNGETLLCWCRDDSQNGNVSKNVSNF